MRVLLYAPSLTGHPQVYCRVIGAALLARGHEVVVAAGGDAESLFSVWRDLRPFADHPGAAAIDTRAFSPARAPELRASELVRLQADCAADATLFIEGDPFEAEFRRIADGTAPRLRGRTAAIFARSCLWYPGEDPFTGRRRPLLAPTVRGNIGRLKRWLLARSDGERHFYEHVLIRRRAVDAVVVKDERITEKYGPPVHWMPEIYRVFDDAPAERRRPDWDRFADPIRAYAEAAGADNLLLFFGAGASYKGYDLFLKLAELDGSVYALHAGATARPEPSRPMLFDTAAIRRRLLAEGRLFETGAYVESADLVDLVFGSVRRFVSTHRMTLSSGTTLQALEAGKPVLTPNTGLVGYRTRRHGLGMTYPYQDVDGLAESWAAFRRSPPELYAPAVAGFMAGFTRERVSAFFLELLTG